ncbi:SpoVR family protein [Bacillus taeanensis]|uniref:Stage V sporulation protein R n=1 Tax=Bacillus taeanensis TaxID=273032 RepID=A0A366XZR5_9BACI|nr:SpoVR family protein [Bacillus taeanensis]RBW69643.1 stage V sporulation protein R [Bacillus taeanensis]
MKEKEMIDLTESIDKITTIASEKSLDFFTMRYEICPSDVLYSIGAYGMPTRFSHWSFGKTFSRMKMDYDFNLSKIYELVINSDPCYAFLLENNTLIQNKLIAAHVLGHSDFFKNNVYFSLTNRDMVNTMALYAKQIHEMEFEYGLTDVEHTLDAVLAIQEHINPWYAYHTGGPQGVKSNDKHAHEEKDLLSFIAENSKSLQSWQKQIVYMLREEMYYFWPQIETKIMNEGWATYWHIRIMRELELSEDDLINFAKVNASVIRPSPHGINPYFLGLKMFESLEKNYGQAFLFEVREMNNDLSFLRNYLTKDLIAETDMYLYGKRDNSYVITNKEWNTIKQNLLSQKVNGGFPYLVVLDGDYNQNGELLIKHKHEGIDLDLSYVEKTLPYLTFLWGKPVYLETIVSGRTKTFMCKGNEQVEAV